MAARQRGAGRNVHVRRRKPGRRGEQRALRQLRAGRQRGPVLQFRLHSLDAEECAEFVAQGPHRPYRRRPDQQRRVELHEIGRHVDKQSQRYVPVPHTVRADPEALCPQFGERFQQSLMRHMRVRRTHVDRDLPRQPSRLTYGVVQRGEAAEVGERAREHVDVQRQQGFLRAAARSANTTS